MQSRNHKIAIIILFLSQFVLLFGTFIFSRTPFIWIFIAFSFVPCLAICMLTQNSKYALIAVILLFITQHGVSIFAYASWGYDFNSDAINDVHVASVISDQSHFVLGEVGYASRPDYSSYPLMHVFYVSMSKVSGLPLSFLALYVQPILNAILVPVALFLLFKDFFSLKDRSLYVALIVFASGFYYSSFQSAFVRESFAFPLALFCIWAASRVLTLSNFKYKFWTIFFFVSVMFSHHISSYMLIAVLLAMTLLLNVFQKNNRLNMLILFLVILFSGYQTYVLSSSFGVQIEYLSDGILNIFNVFEGTSNSSVLSVSNPLNRYFAYSYYFIIGILTLIGLFYLYRQEKSLRQSPIILAIMFVFLFGFLTLLRLSTSADAWSYTYYISLRGTIWSYIGLSFVGTVALKKLTKTSSFKFKWKTFLFLALLFVILGVGKSAQNFNMLSDSSIESPLTEERYSASLWLKENAPHGSYLLVASYKEDYDSFEWARSMAPYAYLKEYFLDSKPFEDFHGYVPLINEYYEELVNGSEVSIVYSCGSTRIGLIS